MRHAQLRQAARSNQTIFPKSPIDDHSGSLRRSPLGGSAEVVEAQVSAQLTIDIHAAAPDYPAEPLPRRG